MKRPGIGTYVIGNPLSALALAGLTAWVTWQWWIDELSGLVPIVVGIVMISAFDAFRRIEDYKLWQREWNAMGGQAPRPSLLPRIRGNLALRLLVGLPLWCLGAYGALHAGNDPLVQIAVALFWIGSLVVVSAPVYRLVMRRRLRVMPAVRDVSVSVCLQVPSQGQIAREVFDQLPPYCATVLRSN